MITTMLQGSTDLSRWLLLAGLLCSASCQSVSSSFENKTGQNESRPRVFSPRMDYDEWTPLGRGDPLKNNPTFDYVPPVLDRVQYWLDSHTTEASAKRDILVLGVTAKKTSPKIPEHFLKFVDGPKFTRTNQDASYRNDFTGSTGAEPPKVVRTTNFRNGPVDYRNQNRIQSIPASYYPSTYYNQKTKPYTMMLPPPLVQKPVPDPPTSFNGPLSKDKVVGYVEPTRQFSTQTEEGPVIQDSQFYALPSKNYGPLSSSPSRYPPTSSKSPGKGHVVSQIETIKSVYDPSSVQPTKSRYEGMTTPSVSFEKSNLIYQSTQTLSGGWPGGNGATSTSTVPETSQSTWQTPDYSRDQYEIDHHAAGSSNHEVVVEQNANIIVEGDTNENEEVVLGQKETDSPRKPSEVAEVVTRSPTTSIGDEEDAASTNGQSSAKMHIVLANSPTGNLDVEAHKAKKGPVTVVVPTNYPERRMNTTAPTVIAETSTVAETEKFGDISKSQHHSHANAVTSSPQFAEDFQSTTVPPNKMIPLYNQPGHSQPAVSSGRHPGNPSYAFGAPQAPLQSLMHPQPRPNHAMMHFLGSMRPSIGYRPASMSMSPPMAHMHAPPMKNMMNHLPPPAGIEQLHQRPPQIFPGMFTSPPAPSTLTLEAMGAEDHAFEEQHRPRAPEATTSSVTPTPYTVTLSSSENTVSFDGSENRDNIDRSPLVKILAKQEEEKGESEPWEQKEVASPRPASSTSPPQTTTVPSLTTDPIFSHYKQPAKPIRGPMYLIIQGHSKVKTYKPTVSKHGPIEKNEISENITERQLSKFEQFIKENTKNGQVNVALEKKKLEEKARVEKIAQNRQDTLMSLVESGLASFTVSPSTTATEEEHQANSVTTIEINGN